MRPWILLFALAAFPALAQEKPATAITIYSSAQPGAMAADLYRPLPGQAPNDVEIPGYATVRETRAMQIPSERSPVEFSDVAAFIDPTTVLFKSLTDPEGTHVLSQNYLFDLVSPDALMKRYLGETITLEKTTGDKTQSFSGTLMSAGDQPVLKQPNGEVIMLSDASTIRFPALPGGLRVKPTLMWDVSAKKIGPHQIEVAYETKGITWWADYNAAFEEGKSANEGTLDLAAWVSVLNRSGAGYKDAKLKLLAGEVQRNQAVMLPRMEMMMKAAAVADSAEGFEEQSFADYHLYTLGRPATIPDNSTQQIELFPTVFKVPVKREYISRGQQDGKVGVFLTFLNKKESGLGMPLPAGRLRVSKRDPKDGSLEFIGEDALGHTAKDEEVKIKTGNAFDIKGERNVISEKEGELRKWREETIEVKLRNHKDSDVTVIVEEQLYGPFPKRDILTPSHAFVRKDSDTVEFTVPVAKDKESVLRYTVRYTSN